MDNRKWGDGGDRCNLCGTRAAVSRGECSICREAMGNFGRADDILCAISKDVSCVGPGLDSCRFKGLPPKEWCPVCKAKGYVSVFLGK